MTKALEGSAMSYTLRTLQKWDNMFVHLTNVAIQKYSEKYSGDHGGKWSTKCLKFFLEMIHGTEKATRCFE
jgi:tubulin polyglutamylase TTLL1